MFSLSHEMNWLKTIWNKYRRISNTRITLSFHCLHKHTLTLMNISGEIYRLKIKWASINCETVIDAFCVVAFILRSPLRLGMLSLWSLTLSLIHLLFCVWHYGCAGRVTSSAWGAPYTPSAASATTYCWLKTEVDAHREENPSESIRTNALQSQNQNVSHLYCVHCVSHSPPASIQACT